MKIAPARVMVKKLITVLVLVAGLLQSLCIFAADNSVEHNENASTQGKLNSAAVNKAQFGRLFTTPKERALLDLQRQQNGFSKPIITSVEVDAKGSDAAPVEAQPQSFKLSGILLRADGQQQVWINGKLQPLQKKNGVRQSGNMVMPTSAALKIPIKKQDQYTTLKPGQVWNPNSRKTTESYLLPVSKPPQVEAPAEVKKPVQKKEVIQEIPAAPQNAEPVEKTEANSESTKAAQ